MRLQVTTEKSMKVTVFDEEKFKSKHDLVGDGTIDLDGIKAGLVKKQTIEILYKGKHAGLVNLEFEALGQLAPLTGGQPPAGTALGQPVIPRDSYNVTIYEK